MAQIGAIGKVADGKLEGHRISTRTVKLVDIPLHVWERQPAETSHQFGLFSYFRDIGPDRTIAATARDNDLSPSTVQDIATKWDWWGRVREWDKHVEDVKQKEFLAETGKMARRQARRAIKLQRLGESRIDQYLDSPELQATLTATDAMRLVAEGAKLERQARGEDREKEKGPAVVMVFQGMAAPKWSKPVEGAIINATDIPEPTSIKELSE